MAMADNANYLNGVDNKNCVQVKQELEIDVNGQLTLTEVNGTALWLCQEAKKETDTTEDDIALLRCGEELYAGHVVKKELVIGPEVLQQPDVSATSGISKEVQEETTDNSGIFSSVVGEEIFDYFDGAPFKVYRKKPKVRESAPPKEQELQVRVSAFARTYVKRLKEAPEDTSRDVPSADRELRVRMSAAPRTYENRLKGAHRQCPTLLQAEVKDAKDEKRTKLDTKIEDDDAREWECDKEYKVAVMKTENNQSVEIEIKGNESGSVDSNDLNPVQDSYITKSLDLVDNTINGELNKDTHSSHNKCKYQTATGETLNKDLSPQDTSRQFVCDSCGLAFNSRQSLIMHINFCQSEAKCALRICKSKCLHKHNIKTHYEVHRKVKNEFCNNSYLKEHFSVPKGENLYSCAHCKYSSSRKSDLKVHLKTHTGEKPYSCTYCEYSCSRKSYLKIHLRKHTGEKPYTCTYCKYSFSQNNELKLHLRKHTGEKPYTCTYCEYSCSRSSYLRIHLGKHTGEKLYTCTYCTYSCNQIWPLKSHLRKHTGEKPYSCTYCDYRCSQKHSLKIHLRKHTGEKPYSCTYCEYRCSQKCTINAHLRKHTGEKPYFCTYCEYRCSNKFHLKIHVRKHTGEKPYSCTYCEYKSTIKCHLKQHLKKHTGEKPYTCKYCEYRCSKKCHLNEHLKNHSGDKPYTCTYCAYRSSRRSNLNVHLKQHTDKKPYTCTHCDYKTIDRGHLKQHLQKHVIDLPFPDTNEVTSAETEINYYII